MSKITNAKRDLADIASDIHALERRSIFDIGDLLIEARDACEHGDWGDWLDNEFEWSHDTADNYMAASHLAAKFRTVRDLKVPARIIYSLGRNDDDLDAAALSAIVEALAKASKSKPISVVCAEEVVNLTRLRVEHGDYPEATLFALGSLNDSEWTTPIRENLKQARPETKEEADQIVERGVHAHYRTRVEALYGPTLPAWLDNGMLQLLEDTGDLKNEEQRKRILQQLGAAPAPLDYDQVFDIIYSSSDSEDDEEADEQPPESAPKPPRPEPETKETDPEQAAAAAAARHDIGPLSQAEHARLETVIAELSNTLTMHKGMLNARDSEIARLEDEVKALKGADLPTQTVNKHIDALIALLKKQSREGQEVAVERLCNALKINPHKISLETEAA